MKIFRLTCGFLLPTSAQTAGSGWANDELLWHCKNMQGWAQSATWLAKIIVCLESGRKTKKNKSIFFFIVLFKVWWCQPKHEKWPSFLQGSHHPTNQLHAEVQEQSGWAPAHNLGLWSCVYKCPGESRLWGALVRGGEASGPTVGQSFNFHSLLDGVIWQLTQPVWTKRQWHYDGKTQAFGTCGTKLNTPVHFSLWSFVVQTVLDWSPPTSRVCSFAWVRTVRQNFYLLSLGTKWTPILVFWLKEKILI